MVLLVSGCDFTVIQEKESYYKDKYVEYYCDGLYWNKEIPCGYIKNLHNETITVEALWNFKGSSPMWIKQVEPNQRIDIYAYNDQATYLIEIDGIKVDLINQRGKWQEKID